MRYVRSDNPYDLAGIAAHDRIWLVEGHGRYMPPEVRAALAPLRKSVTHDYGGSGPSISLLVR